VTGGNLEYALGPLLTGIVITAAGLPGHIFLVPPALLAAAPLTLQSDRPYVEPGMTALPDMPISRPVLILLLASTFRAWSIFAAIAFVPPFLISRGYDLVGANSLVTLMLLSGVGGQVTGGIHSDRFGRKETVIAGLACAIPFFLIFLYTTGVLSVISLVLFGFVLWSEFSVTLVMSHEMMPSGVGLASGLMLGVALTNVISDRFSHLTALAMLPLLIGGAALLEGTLRYSWKGGLRPGWLKVWGFIGITISREFIRGKVIYITLWWNRE
jgi:FSR family fosmidomycin resistance protein-like MFS transporter